MIFNDQCEVDGSVLVLCKANFLYLDGLHYPPNFDFGYSKTKTKKD